MENSLSPWLSAQIADFVYRLTREPSVDRALMLLNRDYGQLFTFSEEVMLKAKTGGPWFIKCRTAFGFTLMGQGRLKGHAFFIFRGTQYLADWLTNINFGPSRALSGFPVHDGFNQTFKTMRPRLMEFMNEVSKSGTTHIHCIGHSLGGAVATLCADWIRTGYKRKPYLYTFGSPRVGLYEFAENCTREIGAKRIYRVYHRTDIVPFLPVWPYIHTPLHAQDYYIPSPGLVPWSTYHDMETYIGSVTDQKNSKSKTWAQLASLKAEQKSESALLAWLKQSTPVSLTLPALELLNQALLYVIDKCVSGISKAISYSIGNTLTLMDQLAYILEKGIDLSNEVSDLVLYLMRKFLVLIGHGNVVSAADLTREYIRYILNLMQAKVNQMVQSILSKTLVKGRAI